MNSLTIEPKIIIFGPPPPNKLQIGENDKTQLANNYITTSVLMYWLFLILFS